MLCILYLIVLEVRQYRIKLLCKTVINSNYHFVFSDDEGTDEEEEASDNEEQDDEDDDDDKVGKSIFVYVGDI